MPEMRNCHLSAMCVNRREGFYLPPRRRAVTCSAICPINGAAAGCGVRFMALPYHAHRLAWPERLKVICVSLGFLLVLGFLGWLFWTFNPVRDADRIWKEFWEPVRAGSILPKGIALLFIVVCYLILLPVACLVLLAGVFHGLRGRRTRLSGWILRAMSQEEVRLRQKGMLKSLDAEGRLSPTDKVLQSYLSPAVGWAILLGLLAVDVGVLVWVATRE